MTNCSTNFI